jgi:hypothetical protein
MSRLAIIWIYGQSALRAERWFRKKIRRQGAQKLWREAHVWVPRNDKVEAQRRRWTFYETIKNIKLRPCTGPGVRPFSPGSKN